MEQEDRKVGRFEDGTEQVIGALIEVHRTLGPGLLESAYEACVCAELSLRGMRVARQQSLPVEYKGLRLDCGYRLDIVVDDRILVELKTVDRLLPIHEAQVVTYLRLAHLAVGLLVNFNAHRPQDRAAAPDVGAPEFLPIFRPSCSNQIDGRGDLAGDIFSQVSPMTWAGRSSETAEPCAR